MSKARDVRVAVCIAFGVALVAACSGSAEPQRKPGIGRPIRRPVPKPASSPTIRTTVPVEPEPIDPEAESFYRAHADQPPTPLSTGEPPKLTARALESTALGEARGLSVMGEVHHAVLKEGQHVSLPLRLATGDCITVIAHGGIGVTEVDAFIIHRNDETISVVAPDGRTGPVSLIGGQTGCLPHLGRVPLDVELVVQVRRGAGPVVFSSYKASR